jgi:hypothetical protein
MMTKNAMNLKERKKEQMSGWRTLREFSDFRDFCFHFRENKAGFSSECLCFQRFFNLPIEVSEIFSTLCSPP